MNRIVQSGMQGFAQGLLASDEHKKTRAYYRRIKAAKLAADLPEDRDEALEILSEASRIYDAMHRDERPSPAG